MLALYAFDMLTGTRLTPLPADTGSWNMTVNTDEQIGCTIPARAAEVQQLGIWANTRLARSGLLAVVDGLPVAAGPIWKRQYTQGGKITLTAGGLRSYWQRRIALPATARGSSILNPDATPNPAFDTTITDVSPATRAKRFVQLAAAWPGGNVPLVLPADEASVGSTQTVKATDLKTIKTLLDNITALLGGPDIAFRPRWNADGTGIYWEMQVGTIATPRLGNADPTLIRWPTGAIGTGAFGLDVTEDGTNMAAEVFGTAGTSSDKVVYSHSYDATLDGLGFALLQGTDTTHNDVTDVTTMQSYTDQDVALGKYAASFWKMNVRSRETGSPRLGDYWLGDMATIAVSNDPVLPAQDYPRRIASISGDINDQQYALTFAQSVG